MLFALGALSAGGCSKDNHVSQSIQVEVGKQCSGPEDTGCGPGGVCVMGFCRHGCATDAECPQGALCLGDRKPYGCSLPSEMACSSHQPCSTSLACAPDGKCRMPCSATAQCPRNEHTCIANVCVSSSESNFSDWESCAAGDTYCEGDVVMACHVSRVGWGEVQRCTAATRTSCVEGACVGWECTPGAASCQGNQPQRCRADGLALEDHGQSCDQATCVEGACEPWVCDPGAVFCDGNSSVICATDGLSEASRSACAAGERCVMGGCEPTACAPGEVICNGRQRRICNTSGDGFVDDGALCAEGCVGGSCVDWVCQPQSIFCDGNERVVCSVDGLSELSRAACAAGETCVSGVCQPQTCTPEASASQCAGQQPRRCRADGLGYEDHGSACSGSTTCVAGVCEPWVCAAGTSYCDDNVPMVCAADGLAASPRGAECSGGLTCAGGNCCTPNQRSCDGAQVLQCAADGLTISVVETCSGAEPHCELGSCQPAPLVDYEGYARGPLPGSPGHAVSYTVNNTDKTVLDNVTGLLWQQEVASGTHSFSAGKTYCSNLVWGGRSDWRLPTRMELLSIVDLTQRDPAIDGAAFPSTPHGANIDFWSETARPGESQGWVVAFAQGIAHVIATTAARHVRCVADATPQAPVPASGHFFEVTGNTVLDAATGLEWQREVSAFGYSQVGAGDYCAGLTLDAKTGWRVPTLLELHGLVPGRKSTSPYQDTSIFPAATPFPDVTTWSNALVSGASGGWVVFAGNGHAAVHPVANVNRVRCVRQPDP
ncbi:MAG: DUF1566 domain-containing protein [Polyangiaceae bacterium]|nr:DUF1566 domain-containing protein [Polyangiaceae bacterium]MCW5790725.1 DUF1566 domain-containing protein [Polyangiaceae bacterium]